MSINKFGSGFNVRKKCNIGTLNVTRRARDLNNKKIVNLTIDSDNNTCAVVKRESAKIVSEEKKQLVQELHVPARRNFPRRKVIIRGFDDLWQADLVDMRYYADTGYHYILTVIDTLSKYGWAIALKTKSEFYSSEFQLLMEKQGINHYSTYSTLKASIVERWNRTFKTEMWKRFTLDGSYEWRNILQQLVDEYNARRHRTIGMGHVDVKPEHAEHLLATVYSNIKIFGRTKFKAGDFV
ncbi:uncharacterized protein [Prorops nasuta]|uniref:uncharacterized protein n=1 Tax=Prorops nasuta TaxID=863751 RepID=UPI0034CEF6BC